MYGISGLTIGINQGSGLPIPLKYTSFQVQGLIRYLGVDTVSENSRTIAHGAIWNNQGLGPVIF
ncbi:Hypothetical protein FKW44_011348 [Caligus rogercresseyi]|uniref:Uncharacterized protein n=1 Tax=Caligus rogercresseyi TaxID=217165 RepID=A0A7T8HI00_CALRO|nr:Hypothetical protein FKW44_011348 [Caligus rogercresseyi]